jgi:acyl CoA:acetate/3-ketoacid CoA transferase
MGTSARLRHARRYGSASRHALAALFAARHLLNIFTGCCTSAASLAIQKVVTQLVAELIESGIWSGVLPRNDAGTV